MEGSQYLPDTLNIIQRKSDWRGYNLKTNEMALQSKGDMDETDVPFAFQTCLPNSYLLQYPEFSPMFWLVMW